MHYVQENKIPVLLTVRGSLQTQSNFVPVLVS